MPSSTDLKDWAASGAMALTGRREGPPLVAPGRPASVVRQSLDGTAESAVERTGVSPALPGVSVLGERAALAGLTRNGPWSCGGAFRAVRTADGWLGLSLARPADVSLVPALVEGDVQDPWEAVSEWASRRTTSAARERTRLLGLPCAAIPCQVAEDRPPVVTSIGGRRAMPDRPRVLDLSSLWAGPLCAHLLGLTGAEVVKVESTTRLDGARYGVHEFFDLLHAGHRMVALDFQDPADLATLRRLVVTADLVLESSRPRALRQVGLNAEEFVEAGTSWLSITAEGRASDAVGFGDDVAFGAGLFVTDSGDVLPCGDALADPLAGVIAAAAASRALGSDRAMLVDVSMHHVAREASRGASPPHEVVTRDGAWWVECDAGRFEVLAPQARRSSGSAGEAGADNSWVLT